MIKLTYSKMPEENKWRAHGKLYFDYQVEFLANLLIKDGCQVMFFELKEFDKKKEDEIELKLNGCVLETCSVCGSNTD
jgi:spore maturation protein CgeB